MSTSEYIQYDIQSGRLYGTFKVIGYSEPYDNKPGVTIQCIKCGKTMRYRYINLKNQYSIPKCSCSGGRKRASDFYGSIVGIWKIVGKYAGREKTSIIQCTLCGKTKIVFNSVINSSTLPNECDCQKIQRKRIKDQEVAALEQAKIQKKEAAQIAKYKDLVGTEVHTYKVVGLSKDGLQVNLECQYCGRKATQPSHRLKEQGNVGRRITKCECERQGQIRLDKIRGKTIFSDRVIGFRYSAKENNPIYYDTFVQLKCLKCGQIREISDLQGLERANDFYEKYSNKSSQVPDDAGIFFYKKCNCVKGQRTNDIVQKYSRFIGKQLDGSRLTITDIWLDSNRTLMCNAKCQCGKHKNNTKLAPILYKHTRQCGCLNIENQQSFHRYYDKQFIGKIIDDLEVLDVTSQETGATIWTCRCTNCGSIENINPKLMLERNWHIGCGCRPIKGSEFNRKYNRPDLIGKDFGGGIIVDIHVDNRGTTWWSMLCPECKKEYSRQAYQDYHMQIGHCGCLNMSWGESCINTILKRFGIDFKREAQLKGLVGEQGSSLRLDFLISYENKLAAIEFDGLQHDQIESYRFLYSQLQDLSQVEDNFLRQKHNDELKDKFCSINSIPLLRVKAQEVKYKSILVEEQIKKFLLDNNIIKEK